MDLDKALRELYLERDRIDRVIEEVSKLQDLPVLDKVPRPRLKRGRKFMSGDERQEVSQRMRNYWAGRRRAKAGSAATPNP